MEKGPVFGLSIGELLGICDHDSQSLRTSAPLLIGSTLRDDYRRVLRTWTVIDGQWKMTNTRVSQSSLVTLRKSGIMRNGRIYAQATWARRTGGKESGLWPTPNTMEGIVPKTLERIVEYNQKARPGRNYLAMNLREQVVYGARNLDGTPQYPQFPTPHSNCHTGAGKRGDGGENLQTAVMWPTPRQTDADRGGRGDLIQAARGNENSHFKLPTPTVNRRSGLQRSMSAGNGGQLNPQFVEWLMGYPLNYTDTRDDLRLSLIRE